MTDQVSHESFVKHARPLRSLVTNDCRNPFSAFFQRPSCDESNIRRELHGLVRRVQAHVDTFSPSHGNMLRQLISHIESTSILGSEVQDCTDSGEADSRPLTTSEKALFIILKSSPAVPPYMPALRMPLGQLAVSIYESNLAINSSSRPNRQHWSLETDPVVAQTFKSITQVNGHLTDVGAAFISRASSTISPQNFSSLFQRPHSSLCGKKRERELDGSLGRGHFGSWGSSSTFPTVFDAVAGRNSNVEINSSEDSLNVAQSSASSALPQKTAQRTLTKFSFFAHHFSEAANGASVTKEALTMIHVAIKYVAVGMPDPFGVIVSNSIPNRRHRWLEITEDLVALNNARIGTKSPVRNILVPLQEMCMTGNLCHRLYAVVTEGQQLQNSGDGTSNIAIGSIGAAALAGLRHALRMYSSQVQKQHTFLSGITPSLYLEDARKISSAAGIFSVIADIFGVSLDENWKPIHSVQQCTSAQFLSNLHNYAVASYQQSTEASKVATTLLRFVLRPLTQMMSKWVFAGVLSDSNSEFFIEGTSTSPSSPRQASSIERFSVNLGAEKLPDFISEDTALDILCAGLAMRMLVNCLQMMNSSSSSSSSSGNALHVAHFNKPLESDKSRNRTGGPANTSLIDTSGTIAGEDMDDGLFKSIVEKYLEALRGQNKLIGKQPSVESLGSDWRNFFKQCEALLFGEELAIPEVDEENLFELQNDEAFDLISNIAHAAGAQGIDEMLKRNANMMYDDEINELYATATSQSAETEQTIQDLRDAELSEIKEIARLRLLIEHELKMKILHWQEQRQLWRSKRNRLALQRNNAYKSVVDDVNAILSKIVPDKLRLTPVKQIVIPLAREATAEDAMVSKCLLFSDPDDLLGIPSSQNAVKKLIGESDESQVENPHPDATTSMLGRASTEKGTLQSEQADSKVLVTVPGVLANLSDINPIDEEMDNANSLSLLPDISKKVAETASISPFDPYLKLKTEAEKKRREAPSFWKQTLHVGNNIDEAAEAAPKVYGINDLAFAELVGYRRTYVKDEAERVLREDFERREAGLAACALPRIILSSPELRNNPQKCNEHIDSLLMINQQNKERLTAAAQKWGVTLFEATEVFHNSGCSMADGNSAAEVDDVIPSVRVQPHIAAFGKLTCSYYSQKALQFLLLPNRGPIRQLLTSLHGVLLMQNNLLADEIMSVWSQFSASDSKFDVHAAFTGYFKSFEKVWAKCPARDWVPLTLSVGVEKIPKAASCFDLLPHLCISPPDLSKITSSHHRSRLPQCHAFLALMPSQAIERYGDIFISLVFWRWVRDLLTSVWRASSQQQAKDVWSFSVLARGVLFTISDFIWHRVQTESAQFLEKLFAGEGKVYAQQKASLDALTDDIDHCLNQTFVATLLAPPYARARRQARTLVRIVEDVHETLCSKRGVQTNNLADFIKAKQREFIIATDALIRHLEGASSMGEDKAITQMTGMIMALKTAIHQRV